MTTQAILKSPLADLFVQLQRRRVRKLATAGVTILIVAILVLAAFAVRENEIYSPANGFGYMLGLVGGSMMLGLLLYPLRKRLQFMNHWGALKHWFRFHMIGGVLGPVLVLFHSTFQIGSLNAAVALSCMLLVATSGLVGRFIYRKIHNGLYGSHTTLRDLEDVLAKDFAALEPVLREMPGIKLEIERFASLVSHRPDGSFSRALHFLSLGGKRLVVARKVRRALAAHAVAEGEDNVASHAELNSLLRLINSTLQAAQRRAQLSTYERLFSLWHVIHIPFLFMLLITAIVHVVAVHSY